MKILTIHGTAGKFSAGHPAIGELAGGDSLRIWARSDVLGHIHYPLAWQQGERLAGIRILGHTSAQAWVVSVQVRDGARLVLNQQGLSLQGNIDYRAPISATPESAPCVTISVMARASVERLETVDLFSLTVEVE